MKSDISVEQTNELAKISPGYFELWSNFKAWIIFLLRKWYVIIPFVIVAGVLGIIYAWVSLPKYESRLTFALEENNGGIGGALSLAAEFGLNLGRSSSIFSGDNVLQIITSRRVIENVLLSVDSIDQKPFRTLAQYLLDLKKKQNKKPGKGADRLANINFPVGKERNSFTYLEDSVLFVMYKNEILPSLIAHRPDKKLGIFELRYKSIDERFAKIFTERLLHETIEFYTELRSKKSRQTMEVLESRVAALRGNVGAAIIGRTAIQDANLNPAFAAAQANMQIKQVDLTAYGGAYAELFKNLELARYQYLQDLPLLQVIDGAEYPLKVIKRGRLFMGLLFGTIAGLLIVTFLTGAHIINKHNTA